MARRKKIFTKYDKSTAMKTMAILSVPILGAGAFVGY
jgi:hypothetical protein